MKRRLSNDTASDPDAANAQAHSPHLPAMVSMTSEQLSELIKSVLSRDVLNSIVSQAAISMAPKRFGNVSFGNMEEPHVNAFLHQKLGKDNLSRRAGPRGTKLTYIESCKAIELANQAFGFNGWSCNILECKEEFREKKNERWSIGFSSLVRIELKDGSSHEDVGFGQADGQPHLGAAIEQAKKASISDARKRALRLFGEYLGNSCYDREHIKDVHSNKPMAPTSVPIPAPAGRPIDHSSAVVDVKPLPAMSGGGGPAPLVQQQQHQQQQQYQRQPQHVPSTTSPALPQSTPASVANRILALQAADHSRQTTALPSGVSMAGPGATSTANPHRRPPVHHTPHAQPLMSGAGAHPTSNHSTANATTNNNTRPIQTPAGAPGARQPTMPLQPHQPHQQQQQQPQPFMSRNAPPPSRMVAYPSLKTEPARGSPSAAAATHGTPTEFDMNDLSLSQFDYDPTGDDGPPHPGAAAKRMRTL